MLSLTLFLAWFNLIMQRYSLSHRTSFDSSSSEEILLQVRNSFEIPFTACILLVRFESICNWLPWIAQILMMWLNVGCLINIPFPQQPSMFTIHIYFSNHSWQFLSISHIDFSTFMCHFDRHRLDHCNTIKLSPQQQFPSDCCVKSHIFFLLLFSCKCQFAHQMHIISFIFTL